MNLNHIIVPVDLSDNSLKALDAAVTLHRLQPAVKVTLIHVMEPLILNYGEFFPTAVSPTPEQIEAAEKSLISLKERFSGEVALDTLVVEGKAWDSICTLAKEKGADLVIVSSHGYTGLERLLLGSTAEQVVRHAACAVMVVKSFPAKA